MDEAQLGAWQAALVGALIDARDPAEVRERLTNAVPWAGPRIATLDERALAVAIDLMLRWSPASASRERG